MKTRRVAAVLIAGGITLMSGPAFATGGHEHKITICHSGNGKHFTSIKVDYAGARGHAKTDSEDIIPPFEDFPGQGDQSILENQCKEATTTTTQSTLTTTTTKPTTSTTVASTTTTLPSTTTTSIVTSTTVPSTTTPTTKPPSTSTTTSTTVTTPPTSVPGSVTTSTLEPVPSTTTAPPSTASTVSVTTSRTSETLPVTGHETRSYVIAGAILLALGFLLFGFSKWS